MSHQSAGWEAAFLSLVAHELRTPLTATRGALGRLARPAGRDGADAADDAAMIGIAVRNTERLVSLVDDWLDLGELLSSRTPPTCAEVDPSALVRAVAAGARAAAAARAVSIAVEVRTPRRLRGDADRLARVLRLAVDGALAAAPPGAQVRVTLDDGDAGVTFGVNAPSFGVSDAQLDALLRDAALPGQLGRGMHEWPDGGHGGLRLPICAAIVARLGGRIAAHRLARRTLLLWSVPSAD